MKKQLLFSLPVLCLMALLMSGCKSKQFVVYSPGENLAALQKVTQSDDLCEYPFGGDNGRDLFFTVCDKQSNASNIYKKDDPFSASMSQKTAGTNRHMAPSYSAATGRLVFAGRQEGATYRDIYLMNAAQGNALTEVTSSPDAEENYPCLSRDGRLVVYERSSAYGKWADTEIWLRNLQTGENTQLGLGRMPSISPDGKKIAFVRYSSDGTTTCLCTMNIDASNQAQLTDAKIGFVTRPCFSPNGRQIVFACMKKQKKDCDLYVVDDNGNNLTQLTFNKSYDGEPYWANDGNIYFTSDRGSRAGSFQIWRFKYGSATHQQANVSNTQSTPVVTPVETPSVNPVQTVAATIHEVKQGETITQIAVKYGVTVREIVKWNNLQSMTLRQGMKLKVSPGN